MRNTWMTTEDVRREIAEALREMRDGSGSILDIRFGKVADSLDPPVAEKPPEMPPRKFKDWRYVSTPSGEIVRIARAELLDGAWQYYTVEMLHPGYREGDLTASPPPPPTLEQKALCCPGSRVRVKDNPTDEQGVPGKHVTGTKFAGRVGRVRGSHDTCSLPVLEVQLDGDDRSYEVWLHNVERE